MATSIIKPVHSGIDYSFTIPANGWTSVAPYTYTWTNSSVTSGCRVEVAFFSGAEDTDVNYLEYEKVSGGIQFTSPVLPTVGIPVVAHIINAQTGNTIAVNDELVSSTAITGASNVNEALTSLSNNLTPEVLSDITWENGITSGSNSRFYKIGRIRILQLDATVGALTAKAVKIIGTVETEKNRPAAVSCFTDLFASEVNDGNDVLFVRGAVASGTGAIAVSSNSARTNVRVRGTFVWVSKG